MLWIFFTAFLIEGTLTQKPDGDEDRGSRVVFLEISSHAEGHFIPCQNFSLVQIKTINFADSKFSVAQIAHFFFDISVENIVEMVKGLVSSIFPFFNNVFKCYF